jgi:probable HAF family extracellular repeat protein
VPVVIASALGIAASAPAQSIRYGVTDLGTIESPLSFVGRAINDTNQVAGFIYGIGGGTHSFLWDDGTMTDIGTLGGPITFARGINNDGSIVGSSDTAGVPQHAFLFAEGQMYDLGTLGGVHSSAHDVNDSGQIVGKSQRPEPDDYSHAFLLDNGRMIDLGTLGGAHSEAHGINAAGDIVGWAWNANSDARATHWPVETLEPIDLGSLAGVEGHSTAFDINTLDQIVGNSKTGLLDADTYHAMLWENGQMTDLGLLPEAGEGESAYGGPALVFTTAEAINDAGIIVGNSFPPAVKPALRLGPFVYTNDRMTNLNDLLLAADSHWLIGEVQDINDSGVIVGTAYPLEGSLSRAVILTPVEVPLGDLNGDFVVGTGDLLQLLAAWGPCDRCLEDLDLDDMVSTSDLLILLANWTA